MKNSCLNIDFPNNILPQQLAPPQLEPALPEGVLLQLALRQGQPPLGVLQQGQVPLLGPLQLERLPAQVRAQLLVLPLLEGPPQQGQLPRGRLLLEQPPLVELQRLPIKITLQNKCE